MAHYIAASDVTCTDEQKVELEQLKVALEELIVRTEACYRSRWKMPLAPLQHMASPLHI